MKTYHRWTLLFVGAWFVSVLLTLNYNGPFFDEGIYITAGERTFEGHGLSDGYLNWFAGSLAWPVLAAVGYKFGGLVGARTVALILAAVALLGVGYTARNLFGPAAGLWTVVALGLNGSFVSLARLAVYDVLALACIGVTLGAVSQLATSDNRGWLVLATLSLVGAAFAKYPAVLMVVPICLLLLTIRHKRAVMDIGLLGTATAALGLAFFLPVREQLAGLPSWRLANSPSFGTGPSVIAFTLLFYSVVPLVLGGISWILARRQKALAGVMFLTLFMWPVYHIVTQDPVGTNKHVVFGFLVAYPLIGYGLSVIWERRHFWPVVLGVVGLLAGVGYVQVRLGDGAWPDLRLPAEYLAEHVEPGQQLLINESWPFTMHLYTSGRIESPWNVFDAYRLTHDAAGADVCDYDWMVDVRGSYRWPSAIVADLERCDSFERVFSSTSIVTNPGTDFRFVSYPVETVIWKDTERAE